MLLNLKDDAVNNNKILYLSSCLLLILLTGCVGQFAADAGDDQRVAPGDVFTLSAVTVEGAVSYQWTQLSGAPLDLPDNQLQSVQVSVPELHRGYRYEFELEISDSDGKKSTDVVVINSTMFNNPQQVSAGFWHSCARDNLGIHCWGHNADGQSEIPAGLVNPVSVEAGGSHSCAIDDSGVNCWGNNQFNQIDLPSFNQPTLLSAGWFHNCVRDANGVSCWGDNAKGQLNVPEEVSSPDSLAAGRHHSCAIEASAVICWGYNTYGQLDIPSGLIKPVELTADYNHTCVKHDSGISCWGEDRYGEATAPTSLGQVGSVTAGYRQSCAITSNGLECWGRNEYGQTDVPANVIAPTMVTSGAAHNCVIENSDVVCWGHNNFSEAAISTPLLKPTAISIGGNNTFQHTCLIDQGKPVCWGGTLWGIDQAPETFGEVLGISSSETNVCAFDANSIECWGNPDRDAYLPRQELNVSWLDGEPGYFCRKDDVNGVACWGGVFWMNQPVPSEQNSASAIALGVSHGCGLLTDGISCWGFLDRGIDPVPTFTNPYILDSGGYYSCAGDNDGVTCWGYDSSLFEIPAPSGLTEVSDLSVGRDHACVIRNSEIECWGANEYGQSDAPDLQNPRLMKAAGYHSCAIDDNGLHCWGNMKLRIPFSS